MSTDEQFEEHYDFDRNWFGRISTVREFGVTRYVCSVTVTDETGDASIEQRKFFDTLGEARAAIAEMYQYMRGTTFIFKSDHISIMGSFVKTGEITEPEVSEQVDEG